MNLLELCNLQGSLFLMILAGAVLKRRGIISKEGEKCLTDLCVNIVIPCNIVKSCLISFCLLYTSPSPRDGLLSRMPSSA